MAKNALSKKGKRAETKATRKGKVTEDEGQASDSSQASQPVQQPPARATRSMRSNARKTSAEPVQSTRSTRHRTRSQDPEDLQIVFTSNPEKLLRKSGRASSRASSRAPTEEPSIALLEGPSRDPTEEPSRGSTEEPGSEVEISSHDSQAALEAFYRSVDAYPGNHEDRVSSLLGSESDTDDDAVVITETRTSISVTTTTQGPPQSVIDPSLSQSFDDPDIQPESSIPSGGYLSIEHHVEHDLETIVEESRDEYSDFAPGASPYVTRTHDNAHSDYEDAPDQYGDYADNVNHDVYGDDQYYAGDEENHLVAEGPERVELDTDDEQTSYSQSVAGDEPMSDVGTSSGGNDSSNELMSGDEQDLESASDVEIVNEDLLESEDFAYSDDNASSQTTPKAQPANRGNVADPITFSDSEEEAAPGESAHVPIPDPATPKAPVALPSVEIDHTQNFAQTAQNLSSSSDTDSSCMLLSYLPSPFIPDNTSTPSVFPTPTSPSGILARPEVLLWPNWHLSPFEIYSARVILSLNVNSSHSPCLRDSYSNTLEAESKFLTTNGDERDAAEILEARVRLSSTVTTKVSCIFLSSTAHRHAQSHQVSQPIPRN